MANKSLAISAEVRWGDRIIDHALFPNRSRVKVGGKSNCDWILPGYSENIPAKTISMDDFINQGTSVIKMSYLNNLMQVHFELANCVDEPKQGEIVPLSFSEQLMLLMSVTITSLFFLYLNFYRTMKVEESENVRGEAWRRAVVTFAKPVIKPVPTKNSILPSKKTKPTKMTTKQRRKSKKSKPWGVLSGIESSSAYRRATADKRLEVYAKNSSVGSFEIENTSKSPGLIGHGTSTSNKYSIDVGFPGEQSGGLHSSHKNNVGLAKKTHVQIVIAEGRAEVSGFLDRDQIRRVIQSHMAEIRYCYERQLNLNPDLFGKVTLQWDIVAKGQVNNVVVKTNSMRKSATARCLAKRLKTWRFPEPPNDLVGRVTYPFVFVAK